MTNEDLTNAQALHELRDEHYSLPEPDADNRAYLPAVEVYAWQSLLERARMERDAARRTSAERATRIWVWLAVTCIAFGLGFWMGAATVLRGVGRAGP